MSKLAKAWVDAAQNADDPSREGYTTPGICAAQKIIASGHKPKFMSEMMYVGPNKGKPWVGVYRLRSVVKGQHSIVQSLNKSAGAGETPKSVASCHTCQELLPLTLCDKERSC
jgi:hypothetical protein